MSKLGGKDQETQGAYGCDSLNRLMTVMKTYYSQVPIFSSVSHIDLTARSVQFREQTLGFR